MNTIVIGLGNPLRGDDGLGIEAAMLLACQVDDDGVAVMLSHTGGLSLAEMMVGYERAILLDAMSTGAHEPGHIKELTLEQASGTNNSTSTHDTSLGVALEALRQLGQPVPHEVILIGMEALRMDDICDTLSDEIRAALPSMVERAMSHIGARA